MATEHFLLSFFLFSRLMFISNGYLLQEGSSPVPAYIFLNNNYKTISSGYWGRPKQMTIKSGHIAYFTSDEGERSLEYVSADTNALCKFQVDVHSEGGTAVVSAWVSIALPVVGMTGRLKFCSAPPHVFKKLPLIPPSEIDCQPWLSLAFPNQKDGYLIYPNNEVQDGCRLEVYSWFMTKSNYHEMRSNDETEVFVPVFDKAWELPLYAAFSTMLADDVPSCWVKGPHIPGADWLKLQHTEQIHQTYKFRHNITAEIGNSGEYTIKCLGMNWDDPGQKAFKIDIIKSLKITFIREPKIVLPGGGGSIVFPSHNVSGSFSLRIYSTSPVNSLTVRRSSGTEVVASGKKQFFAELQYSSPFDILNVYKVGIPWLTDAINGDYQVKVTNDDQESSTFDLKIIKAEAINVLVSPAHVSVGVGVSVSFACLVIGNLVTSVNWNRDFESLQNGKYAAEIQEFGNGKRKGLHLTFLKPQLHDSGHYVCTASNQFERRVATVQLSVWLPGSPEIDPGYESDEATSKYFAHMHGARVLNLTDDEIIKEQAQFVYDNQSSSVIIIIVGWTVGSIVLGLVAVGAIAVLAYGCLRYKVLSQTHPERDKARKQSQYSRENVEQQGHMCMDKELGQTQELLQKDIERDQEIEQKEIDRLFGDLDSGNMFGDIEEEGGSREDIIKDITNWEDDQREDDVTTPLLDKTTKKKERKEKKTRRERGEGKQKRENNRKRSNKKDEEREKKPKKRVRDDENPRGEDRGERTAKDTNNAEMKDKDVNLIDFRQEDKGTTHRDKLTTVEDQDTTINDKDTTTEDKATAIII